MITLTFPADGWDEVIVLPAALAAEPIVTLPTAS